MGTQRSSWALAVMLPLLAAQTYRVGCECGDAWPLAGGGSTPDAGDAGNDAGGDAGWDAGDDAGSDAGWDAGDDAGGDAGADAGSDAGNGSCWIGGVSYFDGATNPSNACQACEVATSTTSWTNALDGSSCGAGQTCAAGSCVSACWIGGVSYADGTTSPSNACQLCDALTTTASWGDVPDGTGCGTDQVCMAGACTTGCWIAGIGYTSGTADPVNVCHSCRPTTSTAAWTSEPDGTNCGAGMTCQGGLCLTATLVPALVSGQAVSGYSFSGTTLTITFPTNPTPGNLVVFEVGWHGNSQTTTATVTDSNNNVYMKSTNSPSSNPLGGGIESWIFYLPNAPSNASMTVTATFSLTGNAEGGLAEFSGVAASSPLEGDAAYNGTASSATINLPGITTSSDKDLLIGVTHAENRVSAVNSPWTIIGALIGNDGYGQGEYYVQPAAGAQAIGFTQTPGEWTAMVAAFKAGP